METMTREEELDWLCRLRSEIYVYMPKEWLIPMKNALDMAIKALEQTEWISVSERLPEEDGFYLATCDGEICGEDEPVSSMAEFKKGKWVDDEDDYQCVLAWMPLPEPYKAEMESE